MKNDERTNAMRLLESAGVAYRSFAYEASSALSGVEISQKLGFPRNVVFKTLVTVADSKKNYVFVIPADKELDLKKAARAAGEKSVSMLKQAQLLPLTGYVHGGCSPVGMKKQFPTFVDSSALDLPEIVVSAGKIGRQAALAPRDLAAACPLEFADLTRAPERL